MCEWFVRCALDGNVVDGGGKCLYVACPLVLTCGGKCVMFLGRALPGCYRVSVGGGFLSVARIFVVLEWCSFLFMLCP